MKILEVTHGFPPLQTGGTENCTYLLSKALNEQSNVEIFVFSGGLPIDYSSSYRDEAFNGVSVRRIHSFPFSILRQRFPEVDISTYKNMRIEKKFKNYLRKVKPNVVHFQHTIGLSWSLISIAIEYGLKPIVTIRDCWNLCPRIQFLKCDGSICENPDNGFNCYFCNDITRIESSTDISSSGLKRIVARIMPDALKDYIKRKRGDRRNIRSTKTAGEILPYVFRYNYVIEALKSAHIIISPSHYLKSLHVRLAGIDPKRITVLPHGIVNFQVKERKSKGIPILFGFCGFPSRHKGAHLLLDVFKRIPAEKGRLIIWGKGWEDISEHKLSKNIDFKGPYLAEKLGDVYGSFDVLTIPSIWGETFSFVAHEAFQARIPVIASRYGVFEEIVKDGENGLLFKVNDRESLFRAIMKIIEKPELIDIFSSKIKTPKTWDQYSSELLQIYSKVAVKNA